MEWKGIDARTWQRENTGQERNSHTSMAYVVTYCDSISRYHSPSGASVKIRQRENAPPEIHGAWGQRREKPRRGRVSARRTWVGSLKLAWTSLVVFRDFLNL